MSLAPRPSGSVWIEKSSGVRLDLLRVLIAGAVLRPCPLGLGRIQREGDRVEWRLRHRRVICECRRTHPPVLAQFECFQQLRVRTDKQEVRDRLAGMECRGECSLAKISILVPVISLTGNWIWPLCLRPRLDGRNYWFLRSEANDLSKRTTYWDIFILIFRTAHHVRSDPRSRINSMACAPASLRRRRCSRSPATPRTSARSRGGFGGCDARRGAPPRHRGLAPDRDSRRCANGFRRAGSPPSP